MKKRVADIIMETLVKYGITDCFAVVGGGAMHLDNALAVNNDINKVFCHHEQACAMAADSYARVSGKMAAVCVTSGPGASNTLTGVIGAWQDSIPMIVLSGQVRYDISVKKSGLNLRYRGIQELDIVPMVEHCTNYAVMITDPMDAKYEVEKAIYMAMNGRRGPAWLDIPMDVQSAIVEEDDLRGFEPEVKKVNIANEINDVFEVLRQAKRPCILLGSAIVSANLREELELFFEKVKVPIIGAAWNADILYGEHELFYGLSGNIGPRVGNFVLQNADVLLVLGNSLSFRQTGFQQKEFAKNAKIIMVDVDSEEPKKPGLNIYKYLQSDLKDFFEQSKEINDKIEADAEWVSYCEKLKERFSPYESLSNIDMKDRVGAYYFWKKFEENAPDDYVLALGNNSGCSSKLQIGTQKKEQRVVTNYTCGSMGFELPAAVGAAVALNREIYCVTGDGSIMMNLQELQTIKQYNLPVKVVVFANDGYNAIRQTSKNFFNGVCIGCTADTGVSFPSFENIANAFEYKYCKCETNEKLEDVLTDFFAMEGNVLLEIEQRYDDPIIPKVMSRMNEDGTFSTPSLEDMYPFIDKEEYDSLMLW